MDRDETTACICGTCLAHISASHVPDLCFACGARYDRTPYALVMLDLATSALHGSITVEPRFRVDFRGAWDVERRASVRTALGVGDG